MLSKRVNDKKMAVPGSLFDSFYDSIAFGQNLSTIANYMKIMRKYSVNCFKKEYLMYFSNNCYPQQQLFSEKMWVCIVQFICRQTGNDYKSNVLYPLLSSIFFWYDLFLAKALLDWETKVESGGKAQNRKMRRLNLKIKRAIWGGRH